MNNTIKLPKHFIVILYWIFFIQLLWTANSVRIEKFHAYSTAKPFAQYIKTNHLEKYKILGEWKYGLLNKTADGEFGYDINVYRTSISMMINAYFEHNIFSNFNNTYPGKQYVINKDSTISEIQHHFQIWKEQGFPDLILNTSDLFKDEKELYNEPNGYTPFTMVYGKNLKGWTMYTPIKNVTRCFIWKGIYKKNIYTLYMRNDIYNKIKDQLHD